MTGERIIARDGSTVINRSNVVNAFNRLGAEASPEAVALNEISKAIAKSGNKSAGLIFKQLVEDLDDEKRDRSTLQEYWKTIVELVPDIAKMADAVAKVTALF